MEDSEVCERRYVGGSQGEAIHVRFIEFLGESEVGDITRRTVHARVDIRTPLPKSNLVEFHL
jgi:hypothetical protein